MAPESLALPHGACDLHILKMNEPRRPEMRSEILKRGI